MSRNALRSLRTNASRATATTQSPRSGQRGDPGAILNRPKVSRFVAVSSWFEPKKTAIRASAYIDRTTTEWQIGYPRRHTLHAEGVGQTVMETMVRSYDKEQHYVNAVAAANAEGWHVVSSAVFQPRSGWARIVFTLGTFALIYPPKPQIIVTYERERQEPQGANAVPSELTATNVPTRAESDAS